MNGRVVWAIALPFFVVTLGSATAQQGNSGPARSWTGFYAGINAGYSWSQAYTIRTAPGGSFGNSALIGGLAFGSAAGAVATTGPVPPAHADGFTGGGQIGYAHQFDRSIVAGIEADFQGMATGDNTTVVRSQMGAFGFPGNPISQSLSFSTKLNWLGTVRGRLGYAVTPELLVYGTGGLAYGEATSSATISQTVQSAPLLPNTYSSSGSFTNTLVGWTAGAGVEYRFASAWSAKAEYLYYDLGSATYNMSPLQNFNTSGVLFTSNSPTATAVFNGNILHAGLNYHF